jgi:hypothetical protein
LISICHNVSNFIMYPSMKHFPGFISSGWYPVISLRSLIKSDWKSISPWQSTNVSPFYPFTNILLHFTHTFRFICSHSSNIPRKQNQNTLVYQRFHILYLFILPGRYTRLCIRLEP